MFTSVVLSVSRLRFAQLLAASVLMGCAASPVREPGALDRKTQAQIVNVVRLELVKGYIFEAVAERMSSHLEEGLAGGAYDQDASLAAFAQHLTEELQEVSHDKHLRVFPLPKSQSSGQQLSREDRQRRRFERLRAAKFGFHKIERLPGNVGYLDLRNFSPASVGRDKAVAHTVQL